MEDPQCGCKSPETIELLNDVLNDILNDILNNFLHSSHIRFVPHRATLSSCVADQAGFPAARGVTAGGEEAPVPHPNQPITRMVF